MEIKQAKSEDASAIAILFDLYRQYYGEKEDKTGTLKFISERLKNNESVIFYVIDSDKISGFVQLYPIFTSVGMRRSWLLNDLFVKEEFRKKGIAKMLIDRCKKMCVEMNSAWLMLETSKNNKNANPLYLKEGFLVQSDKNFYVWETSDV